MIQAKAIDSPLSPWSACWLANISTIVAIWSVRAKMVPDSLIQRVVDSVLMSLLLAFLALAALWTLSNSRSSFTNVISGVAMLAVGFAALSVSPMGGGIKVVVMGVTASFLTFALLAAGSLNVVGVRIGTKEPLKSSNGYSWQFTLRTLVGLTIVSAGYAMIVSQLGPQTWLVKAINTHLMPSGNFIDGTGHLAIMVGMHVAVLVVAFALRNLTTSIGITLLGLCLALPMLVDLRQNGNDDWRQVPFMLGMVVMSVPMITLPWTLAGVETTWVKPVFELSTPHRTPPLIPRSSRC